MKTKTQIRGFTLIELLLVIGIIGLLAGLIVLIPPKYRAWRNVTKSKNFPSYTNVDMVIPFDGRYLVSIAPTKERERVNVIVPGGVTVEGMSLVVESARVNETAPKGQMAFWLALDDNDNIIMRVRVSEYNRAPSGWVIMPKPIPPPIEIR